MPLNIGIIILAAGASSRMGQAKQLLVFRGETLIQRVGRIGLESKCHPIVVVLGANADLIKESLDTTGLEIVHNPDWQEGMGSSLSVGVRHLLGIEPETRAVIVLLVDQPLVTGRLIQKLIDTYEKSDQPIIASSYGQTLGVPALFDQSFFSQLQKIRADRGARYLIKQNLDQVEPLPFPPGAHDMDRPEDWEWFRREYG